MISTLVSLLLTQAVTTGPTIPAGCHQWFHRSVIEVEEALSASDFAKAKSLGKALPTYDVTLQWDDSKVPGPARQALKAAANEAAQEWTQQVPGLKIRWVNASPQIGFSFMPSLPPNSDSPGPAGAVYFQSTDPKEPVVECVLALSRTDQRVPIGPREAYNETLFAIGQRLGLGRIMNQGTAGSRDEGPYGMKYRVTPANRDTAIYNLKIGHDLRLAAIQNKKLAPAIPVLNYDPPQGGLNKVVQGDVIQFSLLITNNGNAPLDYSLVPDCGCFRLGPSDLVPAGKSVAVPVQVVTDDFPGHHIKRLFLYTNDPDHPMVTIPVEFSAVPRYRLLTNQPADTYQVGENGVIAEMFVVVNPDKPFKIVSVGVSGKEAATEVQEWSGEIADPELNLPKSSVKGYVVKMLFSPDVGAGRAQATLSIRTDDSTMPILFKSFYLQRGIAVYNPNLYLGTLGAKSVNGSTILARPDKTFRITKITSESKLIVAKYEDIEPEHQYRVVVHYSGGAPIGYFHSKIHVFTDDPDQPEVTFEVTGNVQ